MEIVNGKTEMPPVAEPLREKSGADRRASFPRFRGSSTASAEHHSQCLVSKGDCTKLSDVAELPKRL
jgi:hypothetical protein